MPRMPFVAPHVVQQTRSKQTRRGEDIKDFLFFFLHFFNHSSVPGIRSGVPLHNPRHILRTLEAS